MVVGLLCVVGYVFGKVDVNEFLEMCRVIEEKWVLLVVFCLELVIFWGFIDLECNCFLKSYEYGIMCMLIVKVGLCYVIVLDCVKF